MSRYLLLTGLCVLLLACHKDVPFQPIKFELMEVPAYFPDLEIPEDNLYSEDRWTLGKKLFYDNMLSIDSTISCGSCHDASLAFSDNTAFSSGVAERPGTSNVPTLANVGFHPYYLREGGVPSLEMQALVPIQEHNELDFNIVLIAERMAEDSTYVEMSRAAYDRAPDAFVITRALANFQRSFISGSSRYDNHLLGEEVLTMDELEGEKLFYSDRLQCGACHSSELFTDFSFANNGLYESYEALGRNRVTNLPEDLALFKVPTLRNIELTAPYMHDGSISTLDQVIDHYETGGAAHHNKSAILKPFILSDREQEQLVSFLKTLTDDSFVSDVNFKEN